MKKSILYTAIVAVFGMPFIVTAEDAVSSIDEEAIVGTGAYSEGALSPATNNPDTSYNDASKNSGNSDQNNAFNEENSDNSIAIGQDGNVIIGNQVDQAVAASDMDSIVSKNTVAVNSAYSEAAISAATNKSLDYHADTINKITGSFADGTGIAVVSQNAGHTSSILQGTLVQSNFQIQ